LVSLAANSLDVRYFGVVLQLADQMGRDSFDRVCTYVQRAVAGVNEERRVQGLEPMTEDQRQVFICEDLVQLTQKLRQGVLAADLAFGTRAPKLDEQAENQETKTESGRQGG